MNISFDYDGVLSTSPGKALASIKMHQGHIVYIITARRREDSEEVYATAKELKIPRARVYFTEGVDKWHVIKRIGIRMHYDNSQEQVDKIILNTGAHAQLYNP